MVRSELAMFRSLRDAIGEAKMLLLQSEMCYNREDQWGDASALAREALDLFEREDHALGQGQAWMAMAEAGMAAGKYKAAAHPAQKAARLFRRAGSEQEELRAQLLASQAEISILGKGSREPTWAAWEEALRGAEQGLKRARALGDQALAASALCQLAEAHNITGDYDEALKASVEAARLYSDAGSAHDVASALHWTADTHIKSERYKEAREAVQEIRKLARDEEDESLEALAQGILEGMAGPSPPKAGEKGGEEGEGAGAVPTARQAPGRLVRNQQGDVMDLRSGLALRPVPMHPVDLADITAKILANYTKEEFDNEMPLMQAGLAGPVGAELQGEWQRKYMPIIGKGHQ